MTRLFKRLFALLSSYGLSCVLFLFLLLLTYLGTISQAEQGLYEVQKKYFESFVLVHRAFGVIPAPLPGGYLLMLLLFLNLACGGIARLRKRWSRLGVLVAHTGICILLVGSFITFKYAVTGHLTLCENEQSNEFESYHEWEIAVAEAGGTGPRTEYLIRERDFARARPGASTTFRFATVPFELTISGYAVNSMPHASTAGVKVVDGFRLVALPAEREHEQNVPGAYVTIRETGPGGTQEGILWGGAKRPFTVEVVGKEWAIDLRRRRWQLPFTIALNKFTRELYPGTNVPKVFKSDVTKIEDGVSQDIQITMNAPLRHQGYTFYQSSWKPGPDNRFYSTLAVVKNPADQFPLYACVVITLGLAFHFTQKLVLYLKKESRRSG